MSTSLARGGMLPAIRSRFTALHPGAGVTLREVGWDDPTAGPTSEQTDVAFAWLPLPDPGRYRWIIVAEEPRLVAMPADGELARRLHRAAHSPRRRDHAPSTRPVPSRLALAWRQADTRPLVRDYVRACQQAQLNARGH
jgi:hypothetical protein